MRPDGFEPGARFGMLTLREGACKKRSGLHVECECACGNRVWVNVYHLRNGQQSCASCQRKIAGQRAADREVDRWVTKIADARKIISEQGLYLVECVDTSTTTEGVRKVVFTVRYPACGHERSLHAVQFTRGCPPCRRCLASPRTRGRRTCELFGHHISLFDVAFIVGCDEKLIRYRLSRGLHGADILRAPKNAGRPLVQEYSSRSHRKRQ